jgi:hypothetical protein
MSIPKVIIQTGYAQKNVSNTRYKIIKQNPNHEYLYFNNNDCVAFIQKHLGSKVAKAFAKLIPGPFKADLFRYCYLYVKGGIYIDLDLLPLVPMDQIVHPDVDFISCLERWGIPGVYQAFMACVPGLSFLKTAIDKIVQHTEDEIYPVSTKEKEIAYLLVTGPCLLYRSMKFQTEPPVAGAVFNLGKHTIFLYRFNGHVFSGNQKIFKNKVAYEKEPIQRYDRLFKSREIYNK